MKLIIKPSDRVLICGGTGSGKSVWLHQMAKQLRQQIISIDVKGDDRWPFGDHVNVYSARELKRELKRNRVVRVRIDNEKNKDELEGIFEAAWRSVENQAIDPRTQQKAGTLVIIHDAIGITRSQYEPDWLRRILVQGRSRNVRVWAGVQKPVGFSTYLRDQADHILVSAQRWSVNALRFLSDELGYESPRELSRTLNQINEKYGALGKHAYIHFERANGRLFERPPLPIT